MRSVLFRLSIFVTLLICLATNRAEAQFETAYIGVNGLTCSQCSRTVELSIRKLNFVSDVQMNLEHTEGKIILKKDRKTDMEKIAQAVVNAGFSVRYLQADLAMNNSVTVNGSCLSYKGDEYVLTEAPKEPLKGTLKLRFIGRKFMPKNEFKKMESHMNDKCANTSGTVYNVTL